VAVGEHARLEVRGIRLSVSLGCLPEERQAAQEVEVDVRIDFGKIPAAVDSDRLEETVDYAVLVARMRSVTRGRHFDLVERLAGSLFAALREELTAIDRLALSVRKVAPPVSEVTGGAVFVLEG